MWCMKPCTNNIWKRHRIRRWCQGKTGARPFLSRDQTRSPSSASLPLGRGGGEREERGKEGKIVVELPLQHGDDSCGNTSKPSLVFQRVVGGKRKTRPCAMHETLLSNLQRCQGSRGDVGLLLCELRKQRFTGSQPK